MAEMSKRLDELKGLAGPKPGSAEYHRLAEQQARERASNPALARHMKELRKQSLAVLLATKENGAGFQADQLLRGFCFEYSVRAMQGGLGTLPQSFFHIEPFMVFDKELWLFRVRNEHDYLVSGEDFLGFITDPAAPVSDLSAAMKLKEGQVHSYSVYDDVNRCMLTNMSNESFGFCSASLVRHGNEVSVMISAGRPLTEVEQEEVEVEYPENFMQTPDKYKADVLESLGAGSERTEDGKKKIASPLNAPGLWNHLFVIRFNIETRRYDAFYYAKEFSDHFITIGKDPYLEAFNTEEPIDPVMLEMAKTALLLPSYIDHRITLVKEETQPTNLAANAKKLSEKRKLERLDQQDRVRIRTISAVRIISPHRQGALAGRSYTPPEFRVHVEGFYRNLANPETYGKDEHGKPIKGKTWIAPHDRHVDKPKAGEKVQDHSNQKTVYLKSRVPVSLRAQNTAPPQGQASTPESQSVEHIDAKVQAPLQDGEGYIYVLINPAMKSSLFKVGYTERDPEERAREISNATGVPTQYLVVEHWRTREVRTVEKLIHARLDDCRLASNREFFSAPYADIRSEIENVLAQYAQE